MPSLQSAEMDVLFAWTLRRMQTKLNLDLHTLNLDAQYKSVDTQVRRHAAKHHHTVDQLGLQLDLQLDLQLHLQLDLQLDLPFNLDLGKMVSFEEDESKDYNVEWNFPSQWQYDVPGSQPARVEEEPRVSFLQPLNVSSPDMEPTPGRMVLPLFVNDQHRVVVPMSRSVITVIDPWYLRMYGDLLTSGERRIAIIQEHPAEKGRLSEIATLLYLEHVEQVVDSPLAQMQDDNGLRRYEASAKIP